MNDKHEFQVGDLVRLKSVEEILALGFGFNERGEIAYPKSKTVLLLTSELKHCGDEFVVDDFTELGRVELKSPNSVERIVNICPSVLELVEVEEDEFEDWISKPTLQVKPGDKVRIKSHWELIDTGWTFDGDYYFHDFDEEVIVKSMCKYLGEVYTVEEVNEGVITLKEDEDSWNWSPCMIAEVVEENTYEEQLPTLKVGDKVRIKTHEELLASGWELEDDDYYYVGEDGLSDIEIVVDMKSYLGEVCTIEAIIHMRDNYTEFRLEEDGGWFYWTSRMVAEIVTDVEVATFEDKYCQDSEVDTYRDEEGSPFDPHSDYTEDEYQPYCAVVDGIKNNPTKWVTCNQTQTKWEDECKTTTWDKERIQRGFENLEMYNKGYADGFQRALDLMKKEFGVE